MIVPFLAASILLPTDQVLVLGGVHFPMLRMLILFGLIRMIRVATSSSGTLLNGGLSRIDTVLIWFSVLSAVAALLLWQQWATFVYQLGELYTALGTYFLLRFLIHDRQDVERMIRVLAWIVVVNAAVMIYEQARGWNPYALLGGARAYFLRVGNGTRWPLSCHGRFRSSHPGRNVCRGVSASVPWFVVDRQEASPHRNDGNYRSCGDDRRVQLQHSNHGVDGGPSRSLPLAAAPANAPDSMGNCGHRWFPCTWS